MYYKINRKRHQDIYWINMIALSLGVIMYCILDKNIEVLSVIVATGISISFGIRQYKIENDKIFKELFIAFNAKYDSKFNNKLNEIEQKDLISTEFKLNPEEQAIIIDYLNLCAEEYLWFEKGRIGEIVWKSWESGMVYYMNIPSINKIILLQKNQKDSYYGLFNRIGNRINNWN